MRKLSTQEMKKINGGVNWSVIAIFTGALSFIIGVLDGIFNYKKSSE